MTDIYPLASVVVSAADTLLLSAGCVFGWAAAGILFVSRLMLKKDLEALERARDLLIGEREDLKKAYDDWFDKYMEADDRANIAEYRLEAIQKALTSMPPSDTGYTPPADVYSINIPTTDLNVRYVVDTDAEHKDNE